MKSIKSSRIWSVFRQLIQTSIYIYQVLQSQYNIKTLLKKNYETKILIEKNGSGVF